MDWQAEVLNVLAQPVNDDSVNVSVRYFRGKEEIVKAYTFNSGLDINFFLSLVKDKIIQLNAFTPTQDSLKQLIGTKTITKDGVVDKVILVNSVDAKLNG